MIKISTIFHLFWHKLWIDFETIFFYSYNKIKKKRLRSGSRAALVGNLHKINHYFGY